MKLISNNIRLQYNEQRQPEVVITSSGNIQKEVEELKEIVSKGKKLSIEVKQHREKRSLDANALLWKMCSEIAIKIKSTKDEVYLQMLERYGVFTHIVVKPNIVDKVRHEWKTVREIGPVKVNGKEGIQLMCFFGSHSYDSKEFAILLDGVISEAKEMGIEVISESEKQLLIQEWGK